MLIAFTGRARHGKTSATEHLRRRYGFSPLSFAEPLKRLCYEGLLNNPPPETSPDRLDTHWSSDRDYWQNRIWTDRTDFSRWLLQFVGTEVVRQVNPNYWVDQAMSGLRDDTDYAVSDLRFMNEAEAVRRLGGVVIKVVRLDLDGRPYYDAQAGNHSSEQEQDLIEADHIIWAPDVRALYASLDQFMEQYRMPQKNAK